jgi:dienelactone hydrolase
MTTASARRGAPPHAGVVLAALFLGGCAGPRHVTFTTEDGGVVHADIYGAGECAVVLAHGGRFDKQSWAGEARVLAEAGFQVVALDFRGYGDSRGPGQADPLGAPLHLDVLAAVRGLRQRGARRVAVLGGSMGATAAAQASVVADPGELDALVLLASGAIDEPERMKGRKLFVIARDDIGPGGRPRLDELLQQYERAPDPKELVILDGSAHAQLLFATDQGERLLSEIGRFLSER